MRGPAPGGRLPSAHRLDDEPIRLFLADVDGTLVTQDKVLTDAAVAAVRSLRQAGVLFALTSGRPPGHGDAAGAPRHRRPSRPSTAG